MLNTTISQPPTKWEEAPGKSFSPRDIAPGIFIDTLSEYWYSGADSGKKALEEPLTEGDEEMPKGSAELTRARKEEIIAACRKLYETRSFKEITLKDIGQETSFTRTSIYNYFETKEEIFLALFQQEYELFVEDLNGLCRQEDPPDLDRFSSELARALERRPLMLKLLSMNLYDMEATSRMERLVEFKTAYGRSIEALDRCLRKFAPQLQDTGRQRFLYAFLPFVYGLYPYTVVTDKQRQAMEQAGISYVYMSTYEMAFTFIRTLLGGCL